MRNWWSKHPFARFVELLLVLAACATLMTWPLWLYKLTGD